MHDKTQILRIVYTMNDHSDGEGGGGNYGDIIYLIGEHESLSSYTAGRRRTGRDGFLFHRQTDPWRGGRSGPMWIASETSGRRLHMYLDA